MKKNWKILIGVLILSSLSILSQISFSLALSEYNLSYDGNGNLIQGFGKYYEYNGFNQLKYIKENNVSGRIISQYFYDADGSRIKKIDFNSDGSNETVYYIGKDFIQIINSSGVFNETYYYDETDLIAKKSSDGKISYYHPDQLGSTNIVTNESGDVIENTSYQPYGEIIEGGNSRYLYTGKEKDSSTGLYYYGARYYNPNQKQFIQPDPIIQTVYDPQSLNRYSYVRNNPYRYIDPSGMAMFAVGIGGSGAYMPAHISGSGNFYIISDDINGGWHLGFYFPKTFGGAIGDSLSGSGSFSFSFDTNTPEELEGWAITGGGSGGILENVGGEVSYSSGGKSIGTVQLGMGFGGEAYLGKSHTSVVNLWSSNPNQVQPENTEQNEKSEDALYTTTPPIDKQSHSSIIENNNLNQLGLDYNIPNVMNTQSEQSNFQSNQYYNYESFDFGGF